MNRLSLLFVSTLIFSPFTAKADYAADRRIEGAVNASHAFRTVFHGGVAVEAAEGVVTLTGTVLDRDQKALAERTARVLPGVVDVISRLALASSGPERADGWITLRIRGLLLLRSDVGASDAHVSVHDGVVTLQGAVDTLVQRQRLEAYAFDVEGVRSVRNELAVRIPTEANSIARGAGITKGPDDNAINADVQAQLLVRDAAAALRASIATAGGTVVIRGSSRSAEEKERVTIVVRGVRGVLAVSNEMVVSAAE